MNLSDMHNINLLIFNFINGGAGLYPALDVFLLFFTSYVAYGVSIGIGMYMTVVVPMRIEDGYKSIAAFKRGLELCISALTTWLIVKIIKTLIASPRPFITLTDIQVLSPHESGYSFPSGHTSMTTAIATVVYFYNKRLGTLLYLFALVVAISRIYVGVHYPIDVVAGFLIGILVPWGIHYVVIKRQQSQKK